MILCSVLVQTIGCYCFMILCLENKNKKNLLKFQSTMFFVDYLYTFADELIN